MEMLIFLDAPRFRRKDHFCCKVSSIRKFVLLLEVPPPRRYTYFGVVAGLVCSNDPESYAGSSVCYW
jgi:hypothetical protein